MRLSGHHSGSCSRVSRPSFVSVSSNESGTKKSSDGLSNEKVSSLSVAIRYARAPNGPKACKLWRWRSGEFSALQQGGHRRSLKCCQWDRRRLNTVCGYTAPRATPRSPRQSSVLLPRARPFDAMRQGLPPQLPLTRRRPPRSRDPSKEGFAWTDCLKGIVKSTDCRLFSAFLHEAKPLSAPG